MSALLQANFVLSNKQKNILVDETGFQYRLKTKIKDAEYGECYFQKKEGKWDW